MGAGDIGHLPEEAIKVYPWHQDDLCRTKEEEGQKEPHCLLERGVNCFLIRAHKAIQGDNILFQSSFHKTSDYYQTID